MFTAAMLVLLLSFILFVVMMTYIMDMRRERAIWKNGPRWVNG